MSTVVPRVLKLIPICDRWVTAIYVGFLITYAQSPVLKFTCTTLNKTTSICCLEDKSSDL